MQTYVEMTAILVIKGPFLVLYHNSPRIKWSQSLTLYSLCLGFILSYIQDLKEGKQLTFLPFLKLLFAQIPKQEFFF